MAGDWIKLEHATLDKPEILELSALLSISHGDALLCSLRVWVWLDQQSRDGHGVRVTRSGLDTLMHRPGLASALESVGWLSGQDGALCFTNFERHNGKTAKDRALATNRKRSERASADAAVTVSSRSERDNGVTREEKRRSTPSPIVPTAAGEKPEVQRELGILALVPSGGGTSGRRRRRAAFTTGETALAREVLDYLNAVTKHRFQPVPKNVGFIVDRLAEGYTSLVLKLVAYHRLTKWRHDPKMIEYLRPETLYNETKCAQYAGQVPGAYFKTCGECSAEILPDMHGCPSGCEVKAEAARVKVPMPEHVRRREGESVRDWMKRLKPAAAAA